MYKMGDIIEIKDRYYILASVGNGRFGLIDVDIGGKWNDGFEIKDYPWKPFTRKDLDEQINGYSARIHIENNQPPEHIKWRRVKKARKLGVISQFVYRPGIQGIIYEIKRYITGCVWRMLPYTPLPNTVDDIIGRRSFFPPKHLKEKYKKSRRTLWLKRLTRKFPRLQSSS